MRNKLLVLGFICFFCLIAPVIYGQTITAGTATGTIIGCAGSASASPNLQQIVVTGTGLSTNITATAPSNFELSLAASGPFANTIALPQSGAAVYVRSSVTAPIGNISGNVSFSSVGANTSNAQVSATIKALPVVNAIADQTAVISGNLTAAVKFTGTSPAYKWTNSNPGIGIGASGSGNIPSFTAVNTGTTPIKATFTVTPAPAGFIFTANTNDNSVSVISAGNNSIIATIPVGPIPTYTLAGPDQSKAYVGCYGEVDVLNALNNTLITKIHTGGVVRFMLLSKDKTKLYVLIDNQGLPGAFVVIDLATNTVVGTVTTEPTPMFAVVSNDGTHVYISTYGVMGGGPTQSINVSSMLIDNNFMVTAYPSGILLSPDGNKLYLSDVGESTIVAINLSNNVIVKIPVGRYPLQPSISPDGNMLYVCDMLSNNVSVINTATNSVIVTIPSGAYDKGTALTPDGKFLYVTERASQEVKVINTATTSVIATIPLAGIGMDSPVMSSDGNTLYVSDLYNAVIHVINTATNTLVTDIPTKGPAFINNTSISTGSGCTGAPVTFTITVTPPVPVITTSGSLTAVNTSYGIPSASTSFTVSGANLSTGITVTPPPGFEASTDNVTFSSIITVGGANTTVPIAVYIRLAATTNAGAYSGNIVLSSNGAASASVTMPNSIVSPSILDIIGTYSKIYGDVLTDFTLYYNTPNFTFNLVGLRNGNTFKSIKFAFDGGAAATDPVNRYLSSVTLSDFEGDNGFLPGNYIINYFPFDLVVLPAPVTITANNVNKPYGAALADELTSTNFTVTGLKNNETVGNVRISYGLGAPAPSSPGLYTSSVVPFGAAGGTFLPGNYDISYQAGNLTVNAPSPPVITYPGLPLVLQTTYGTPSSVTSIQVSGANLASAIAITPPAGFEIGTDNRSFGNIVTLLPNAVGTVAATTIYIRLAANAPVGNYANNLTLANSGAGNVNIPLTGTVKQALLTVAAKPAIKIYGTALVGGAGSTGFTTTGLQNGETIGDATLTYGYGSAVSDPVGVYNTSLVPSAATHGSFNSNNYTITYVPASITVNQAALTITADNLSRAFATPNPTLTATYTGLVNNESPAQLTLLPIVSTNAILNSPSGQYPIMVSGAFSPNYAITYVPGMLTIYAAPQNIIVPNIFTPNSDGTNDLWVIKDLQYYPNCTVEVYNRYGQQLYHSRGYNQPWDGAYNSRPLPFGTYYYIINLNDGTPTKLSGYVAIVK